MFKKGPDIPVQKSPQTCMGMLQKERTKVLLNALISSIRGNSSTIRQQVKSCQIGRSAGRLIYQRFKTKNKRGSSELFHPTPKEIQI